MDQSNKTNYVQLEHEYFARLEEYFNLSSGTFTEKAHAFSRFMPRQAISYFIARNEIFKEVVPIHGSILDFGLYRGSSFFTWLQLSAIYEPYNHIRKIIGFDSFEGFSEIGVYDEGAEGSDLNVKCKGGMAYDGLNEIQKGIDLFDLNRPLGHIDKGRVIKGQLPEAFEVYLEEHQETIVSLANFGLGLYEPTVALLKLIKPRLVRGSVIVFEDLNQATWPGETKALLEVFESNTISIKRAAYCPHISWVIVDDC